MVLTPHLFYFLNKAVKFGLAIFFYGVALEGAQSDSHFAEKTTEKTATLILLVEVIVRIHIPIKLMYVILTYMYHYKINHFCVITVLCFLKKELILVVQDGPFFTALHMGFTVFVHPYRRGPLCRNPCLERIYIYIT